MYLQFIKTIKVFNKQNGSQASHGNNSTKPTNT